MNQKTKFARSLAVLIIAVIDGAVIGTVTYNISKSLLTSVILGIASFIGAFVLGAFLLVGKHENYHR